ncbi:ABC transporter transmembrane domain-containing protein [Jatrophihabitans fulvus]
MPDATTPSGAWGLLRRMLRRRGRLLTGSYLLLAVWATSEALVPVVLGAVIDHGIATGDVGAFVAWLGVLAAVMAVLSYGYRFGARLGMRATQDESHALRVEIAERELHPRGADTDLLPGEVLSLATGDADQVGLLLRLLAYALGALTAIVVSAVYLLRVDVTIGLVVLVGVPVVLGLVQVVSPVISRRSARQHEVIAHASGLATDIVRGLRPLKGFGGEGAAVARYRRASRVARDASVRTARSYGYLFGLTTGLSGVFLAFVALLAGRAALAGDISLGELVAVVGLTQFLAEPITGLGEVSAYAASAHGSAGRIARFLHSPHLIAVDGSATVAGTAALELDDVRSGPLRGLSLRCDPGRFVALAVDDPATADALLDVLAGRRPDAGRVTLGGVDLAELSIAARRSALLVCPHHVDLFEGTLRSNVDPHDRLDADDLAAVLAASAADDVVASADGGLDAPVSPSGSTLSGGQRQRVALARALAAPAPVLVLHEPTSAVDAVTEQAIARGVGTVRAGLSTLVVTSSPALLDLADEVVVVRDGRVAARGAHRDLVAGDAAYRQAVVR